MEKKIKLNMVDNGLDFLLKSLNTINNSDEDLKYSIINLHAGIQLLLKELLYQEHWSLIFQKIENADPQKLISGDFISVSYDALIQRLQKISQINFDNRLLDKLEWLRKERNKTEHYHLEVSVDTLKSNIVTLLSLFIPFLKTEMIANEYIEEDDVRFTEVIEYLHEFDAYIVESLSLLSGVINNLRVVLQCPVCYQMSVEFRDESNVFCYFCDEVINDFSTKYMDNILDTYSYIKDGGESPLYECPECELETFINLDEDQFICLSCGITPTAERLATCDGPKCNGTYVYRKYDDDAHFCHYCMESFGSC